MVVSAVWTDRKPRRQSWRCEHALVESTVRKGVTRTRLKWIKEDAYMDVWAEAPS